MSKLPEVILDGVAFAAMLSAGAANLAKNADIVNDLNVFPIPDGDTGTNMRMTLEGGVRAAARGGETLGKVADAAADGMLFSARGNSGVILSQFFGGLAEGLRGHDTADVPTMAKALAAGVRHAYGAVREPVEGTMLTVMREAAEEADGDDLVEYFTHYIEAMHRSLDHTPELLPVLKEAGVIDSGGAGLIYIFEGMARALAGEEIELSLPTASPEEAAAPLDFDGFDENTEMRLGYCTEFLLRLQNAKVNPETFDVSLLTDFLDTIGDSIVATKSGSIVKVHVHTLTPGVVLGKAQEFGEFLTLKIENMELQHSNTTIENRYPTAEEKPREHKKYAFVTVATGEGLSECFTAFGADVVITGGQTMNPSAEDFLNAFATLDAENIFVLPNNSNILMTAEQAAGLYKDARVLVANVRTLAEAYMAFAMLDPEVETAEELLEAMNAAASSVTTGEVTTAVRDCELSGIAVHKNDYIGFSGKTMLAASPDRETTVKTLIDRMDKTDKEVLIVIFGASTPESEVADLRRYVANTYPSLEWYEVEGGQEVYDYILSLA